jgi:hypothetical protein
MCTLDPVVHDDQDSAAPCLGIGGYTYSIVEISSISILVEIGQLNWVKQVGNPRLKPAESPDHGVPAITALKLYLNENCIL